jgi:hypothetical protein
MRRGLTCFIVVENGTSHNDDVDNANQLLLRKDEGRS